jgi:hypothetical protein
LSEAERVTELEEARELVGGVRVDRAAGVLRAVGDQAHRVAADPRERGDGGEAELTAELEDGAG